MSKNNYDSLVPKVATLANVEIAATDQADFVTAFTQTIDIVDQLQQIDVTGVEPTTRLSQGVNRWRTDEVKVEQMFTQEQALANASQTHDGYFMVGRLIDDEA